MCSWNSQNIFPLERMYVELLELPECVYSYILITHLMLFFSTSFEFTNSSNETSRLRLLAVARARNVRRIAHPKP